MKSLAVFVLIFCAVACPPGARAQEVEIATSDTGILLKPDSDTVRIEKIYPNFSGLMWDDVPLTGAAEQFVPVAIIGEISIPLHWTYSGRAGDGFRFTSAPGLTLDSVWHAEKMRGPIEHTIRIRNETGTTVALPLQPTLAVNLAASDGLQHWWVEKGAGNPSDIGTHHDVIGTTYSVDLHSTPYSEERHRDAIPWMAIHNPRQCTGLYFGIEFSGRVHLSVRTVESSSPAVDCGSAFYPMIFGSVADREHKVALGGADDETCYSGMHRYDHKQQTLAIELGLENEPGYTTVLAPGAVFETPAVFIGHQMDTVDDGANVLHRWIESQLRPKPPTPKYPVLTNNSWGSGMAVDEKLARRMIDESAELGLEMFHIDAGWFRSVGDWHPSPEKFPNGLGPVADYAHSKGLLFGLWTGWTQGGVATTSNSQETVLSVFDPKMGPWFTHDYPPEWKPAEFSGADVCLAAAPARAWCLDELRRMVRDYKLDLLEHDQRMIVSVCERSYHGHTASKADVAYRACNGYYDVYDTLRAENPKLMFEDCVNGGRMVDFGVLRRVHYISITDTYTPLANRRAFHDSSYPLPPSMCEAYIANVPAKDVEEFLYMLRSGMMGWCTIMCDTTAWSPEQHAAAKKQFVLYKDRLRPLINNADLYHVSDRPDGVIWDGMEYLDPQSRNGVIYAFRGTTSETKHIFKLKGLIRAHGAGEEFTSYTLAFEDGTNPSVTASAMDLERTGVAMTLANPNSSELVWIRRN